MDTQIRSRRRTRAARIVYVRPVEVADLPRGRAAQQAEGLDTLYAVHSAEGERLALVRDRSSWPIVLARQNDMEPVAVH